MAIQMRRGEKEDFDPSKLKVGEFAVPTDTGEVYIKTSENTTKGMATLNSSGKLEQMPTYTDVGAAPSSHNHSAANITSGTLPVSKGGTGKSTLDSGSILLGNGTSAITTTSTLPISKGGTGATSASAAVTNLGASPQNHASTNTTYGVSTAANYGHAMASSTTPIVAGTANVGSETSKFARGDHVHPVQTSVSGNAGTATKLQTARTISTSGGATGTATSFNGSANITIPITSLNPTYLSSATPINKGGTGATTADTALTNLGAVPISRTINSKALSGNISLTASDVGAAASSHGNHVPTTQTASNKIFLRNDNSWQTVTPANIGAVPTTRKVNSKPLSSDVILTPSDIGAANEQHNHSTEDITSGLLPIDKGGTNADTATDALNNLGAVPTTRTINNKELSANISLTSADVGAATSSHSHTFSSLTSKPTTLSGYGITDSVPSTRKINNKALSSDISLTASDVGAATTSQGTKADSAIQGVKVNGNLLTPDSSKVVNVDATSIGGATAEQGAKADSAIQGIQGNGTTITPNSNKVVNITPTNIGAVPTSRTINSKALSSNITLSHSDVGAAAASHGNHVPTTQTASNKVFLRNDNSWQTVTPANIGAAASSHGNHVPTTQTASNKIFLRNDNSWQTVTPANIGAAASSHNHSAANITSGTLSIERGGTGATSVSTALSNLGIPISSGTWTPTLGAREGTAPSYTVYYRYGRYLRINNLVYIAFHIKANITSKGSGYSTINGLPFTSSNNMNGQGFALRETYGAISYSPGSAFLSDSTATLNLQSPGGEAAQMWQTGDVWVGFSGCYIKS